MSWDKNTINMSFIDSTIKVLKNLEIKYQLTKLGEVEGYGNNDIYCGEAIEEDHKTYSIRKLEYGNKIIFEQMLRSEDCDMDDYLVSIEYESGKEPKTVWKLEKNIQENIV